MGSRERRTRERVETREKILDAARQMFVRHGYEATTMRAIADKIEYTPTAIYHHFRNKDALLTELASSDFRALAAAFNRIGRIEDPIDRLHRIGEAYVEFALAHPMQYQLMFMTPKPEAVIAQRMVAMHGDPTQDAYTFLREACADAIESGRLRAEFGDPHELAQMLWSSMHGILALQMMKKEGPVPWRDPRQTARRIGEAIVRGLLRDPES
jgi:AcrR family transcriptional regulator